MLFMQYIFGFLASVPDLDFLQHHNSGRGKEYDAVDNEREIAPISMYN